MTEQSADVGSDLSCNNLVLRKYLLYYDRHYLKIMVQQRAQSLYVNIFKVLFISEYMYMYRYGTGTVQIINHNWIYCEVV